MGKCPSFELWSEIDTESKSYLNTEARRKTTLGNIGGRAPQATITKHRNPTSHAYNRLPGEEIFPLPKWYTNPIALKRTATPTVASHQVQTNTWLPVMLNWLSSLKTSGKKLFLKGKRRETMYWALNALPPPALHLLCFM